MLLFKNIVDIWLKYEAIRKVRQFVRPVFFRPPVCSLVHPSGHRSHFGSSSSAQRECGTARAAYVQAHGNDKGFWETAAMEAAARIVGAGAAPEDAELDDGDDSRS